MEAQSVNRYKNAEEGAFCSAGAARGGDGGELVPMAGSLCATSQTTKLTHCPLLIGRSIVSPCCMLHEGTKSSRLWIGVVVLVQSTVWINPVVTIFDSEGEVSVPVIFSNFRYVSVDISHRYTEHVLCKRNRGACWPKTVAKVSSCHSRERIASLGQPARRQERLVSLPSCPQDEHELDPTRTMSNGVIIAPKAVSDAPQRLTKESTPLLPKDSGSPLYLYLLTLCSTIGGFLFGYDTVTCPPHLNVAVERYALTISCRGCQPLRVSSPASWCYSRARRGLASRISKARGSCRQLSAEPSSVQCLVVMATRRSVDAG